MLKLTKWNEKKKKIIQKIIDGNQPNFLNWLDGGEQHTQNEKKNIWLSNKSENSLNFSIYLPVLRSAIFVSQLLLLYYNNC